MTATQEYSSKTWKAQSFPLLPSSAPHLSCVSPFPWFTLRFRHAQSFPVFTNIFYCLQTTDFSWFLTGPVKYLTF